ncbi:hypothetical protein O9G_001120 [Rozella allomycis CSF55]|uniref:Uncharacterized protein n=1 Tax=Rozella allomycis (strain CSF55) TaxID=988480 RepID=A0A075ASA6_ROZAC|nr:hypothetical protein O9G_001120 [Rozella allomycis CSF55]|eukprot:EPZ33151.1 hypothetical protein O9G_001120 [Rozella allomycis CSF55]
MSHSVDKSIFSENVVETAKEYSFESIATPCGRSNANFFFPDPAALEVPMRNYRKPDSCIKCEVPSSSFLQYESLASNKSSESLRPPSFPQSWKSDVSIKFEDPNRRNNEDSHLQHLILMLNHPPSLSIFKRPDDMIGSSSISNMESSMILFEKYKQFRGELNSSSFIGATNVVSPQPNPGSYKEEQFEEKFIKDISSVCLNNPSKVTSLLTRNLMAGNK